MNGSAESTSHGRDAIFEKGQHFRDIGRRMLGNKGAELIANSLVDTMRTNNDYPNLIVNEIDSERRSWEVDIFGRL